MKNPKNGRISTYLPDHRTPKVSRIHASNFWSALNHHHGKQNCGVFDFFPLQARKDQTQGMLRHDWIEKVPRRIRHKKDPFSRQIADGDWPLCICLAFDITSYSG